MASLTTTNGAQFTFDPNSVIAVADHDAATGEAVTCVYGLTAGVLKIYEAVVAFLARIGVTAKFATLTRPNGSPIWINGSSVSTIRAPLPGEYTAAVKSVISVGSLIQGVTEDPASATVQIDAHGGNL